MALWRDKVVLTGGDDCIKAWDVASLTTPGATPKMLGSAKPPQQTLGRGSVSEVAETNGLSMNRAGTTFFSANGDGKAYGWDVETMKCTGTFEGHTDYLLCCASQGDNGLVTGSEDGTVRLWDTRTGKVASAKDAHLMNSQSLALQIAPLLSTSFLACPYLSLLFLSLLFLLVILSLLLLGKVQVTRFEAT